MGNTSKCALFLGAVQFRQNSTWIQLAAHFCFLLFFIFYFWGSFFFNWFCGWGSLNMEYSTDKHQYQKIIICVTSRNVWNCIVSLLYLLFVMLLSSGIHSSSEIAAFDVNCAIFSFLTERLVSFIIVPS